MEFIKIKVKPLIFSLSILSSFMCGAYFEKMLYNKRNIYLGSLVIDETDKPEMLYLELNSDVETVKKNKDIKLKIIKKI